MSAFAAAAATCWCCAVLVIPRLRLRDDPAVERQIAQRLGRRRRLVCIAVLLTLLPLGMHAHAGGDADLAYARSQHRLCTTPSIGAPTCYRWLSTGAWIQQELSDDGIWLDVGIVSLVEPYSPESVDADSPLHTPYVEDPGSHNR